MAETKHTESSNSMRRQRKDKAGRCGCAEPRCGTAVQDLDDGRGPDLKQCQHSDALKKS
jgi:hypothetical protein